MASNTFLYPNVTNVPGQASIHSSEQLRRKTDQNLEEFEKVFDQALGSEGKSQDLGYVKAPLKFSAHATQRLKDRKIVMDSLMMSKVNDAIDKAEAKGVEDTLVLTPDAALIVSVKNRTVITAMDRSSLNGNVFTNIDAAVIV